MTKKIYIAITCIVLCFQYFFTFEKCSADGGFSINPFYQNVDLDQNSSEVNILVNVSNNTNGSAVFKISVVDFGSLDETGGVVFAGSSDSFTSKYKLASWVRLEKDALVLEAGETQSIKIAIINRESLSPGGHYAAVMVNMDEAGNFPIDGSSNIAVDSSVSSLIFLRKIGGETYDLKLKEQTFQSAWFQIPSKAQLRFQNSGNVHVVPRGYISIVDPIGREVSRGIINQDSALILPETFRAIPTQINKVGFAYLPGKYQIKTFYRYDSNDNFSESTKTVFIIPIAAVGICIIFLTILFTAFFWYIRKKRHNR